MRIVYWVGLLALVGCGGSTQIGAPGGGGQAGSGGRDGTAAAGGSGGEAGTGGSAGSGGTAGTDAGMAIWPADATRLRAVSAGGGEMPAPPPGSNCTLGAVEYRLDVASRKLAWTRCESDDSWTTPWIEVSGSRTLSATEYEAVDAAMLALTVYAGDMCGADKPIYLVEVTTPKGTFSYYDNFYACMGNDRVYVENIDGVFGTLRELVN